MSIEDLPPAKRRAVQRRFDRLAARLLQERMEADRVLADPDSTQEERAAAREVVAHNRYEGEDA